MTSAIDSVDRMSIAGEKAEVMPTAATLASRLAALRPAEALDVLLGAVERLRLAHADDLLLQIGGDGADGLARLAKGGAGARGEEGGDAEHRRNDRVADEREPPVEQQHGDEDADERQERAEELRQPLRQELIERVDVAQQARHQVADRPLVEPRQRQPLQVREQPLAQRRQQVLAGGADAAHLRALAERGHDVDAEEDRHRAAEAAGVVAGDVVVDGAAHHPRAERLSDGVDDDVDEGDEDEAAPRLELGEEPARDGGPVAGALLVLRRHDFDRAGPPHAASSALPSGRICEPRISL